MHSVYMFCAIFGCTFVVLQFTMMLLMGVGGESDTGDGSFDSDSGDFGDSGGSGDAGDAGDTGDAGDSDGSSDGQSGHHSGHSIFGFLRMLSLRTVTAGMGFFGLAGLAAHSGGLSQSVTMLISLASGLAAIVLVYCLYRFISSFNYDGSISESTLVGCHGVVYVRIPPVRSGSGKVIVTQQERSMEYEALSDAPELITAGTPITVTQVLSASTVVVKKYD